MSQERPRKTPVIFVRSLAVQAACTVFAAPKAPNTPRRERAREAGTSGGGHASRAENQRQSRWQRQARSHSRKASSVMDERLRFVARLLDGEAMTDVCREFGVSRKTGYKIFDRYKEHGLEALTDRSRRPGRYADQLPDQIQGVPVVNQIRIYWWCSRPGTGRQ